MSLIRNVALATVFSIPAFSTLGCNSVTEDKTQIEKPLAGFLPSEYPGLGLYDENNDNKLSTEEALKYARVRIIKEHAKNGELTDKAIKKIQSLASDLNHFGTNRREHYNGFYLRVQTGPISQNYLDTENAFREALEVLLKEERDKVTK